MMMTPDLSKNKVLLVAVIHVIVIIVLVSFRGCSTYKPQENALEMVPLGTDNPGEGMPVKDSAAGEQASAGPETSSPQPEPQPQQPTPPQPSAPPPPKIPEPATEPEKEEPRDVEPSPIPDVPKPPVKKVEKKSPPKPEPKKEQKKPEPKPVEQPEKKAAGASSVKVDLTKKVVRNVSGGSNSSTAPVGDKAGGGGKGKEGSRGINKGDIEGAGISAGTLRDSLVKSLQSPGIRGGTGSGQFGSPDGKNSEAARYNLLIKETIERNWRKPSLPGIAQLETTVLIRIAPDGTLTFITTRKPSGNSDMDNSVETAIRVTPRIPERVPDGLGTPNYDVSINFRLR